MKKKIFFPIEIVSRELDSKLLILVYLLSISKNNWEVYIGNSKKLGKYYSSYSKQPFIYFEKGIEYNTAKLKNIIYNNGRTLTLDEEGGIYTKSHNSHPRGGFNNPSLNYIEKMFFWGENSIKEWNKNHKNLQPKQICLSGNPRFDLSKKKFHEYYVNLSKKIAFESYVLISTAFGSSNPLVDIQNSEREDYWKKISTGKEYSLIKVISEYQSKLFPLYIEGIKLLIEKYPNEFFILRPHPGEDLNTYYEIFNSYKNVLITNEGAVQNYLPKTKIMIHNGCTTAIEALAQELNPICYFPLEDLKHSQYLTLEASDIVTNVKDLLINFDNKLQKKNNCNIDDRLKIIKNYIYNIKDIDSFELIANEIENIKFEHKEIKISIKEKIKNHLPINILKILKNIKFFLFTSKSNKKIKIYMDLKNQSKFPDIKKNEIIKRINLIKKILKLDININVKELEKNIFCIK